MDHVKALLLSSVSFESAVITCELEDTARERSANVNFEGRHERRPIEGQAAWSTPSLGPWRVTNLTKWSRSVLLVIATTINGDAEWMKTLFYETEYAFGQL